MFSAFFIRNRVDLGMLFSQIRKNRPNYKINSEKCDIWYIIKKENPRIKIRWQNLWNIFFLIFHDFVCLILYYPTFYSSLSDKKQRNGGISKISVISVQFSKNRCWVFCFFYFLSSNIFWKFSNFIRWAVKPSMIKN